MGELVQDSAASQRALISTLLSLAPGEPLWEHTGLDIHLPVIPALRPSCLVCRALLKMGALNKLGLI